MKKLLLSLSLCTAFAAPAQASSPATEVDQVFHTDSSGTPMQVAVLSSEEMAQTQGAYVSPRVYYAYRAASSIPVSRSGASSIGMSILNTLNTRAYGASYGSLINQTLYSRLGGYYRK